MKELMEILRQRQKLKLRLKFSSIYNRYFNLNGRSSGVSCASINMEVLYHRTPY